MARLKCDPEALKKADAELEFELDGWIDTAPFEDLLGMKINEAAGGRAVLSFPFRVKLAQGGGFLHGGALTALADTAVAMAIKSVLPAGTVFGTTDLSVRFLAPVKEGTLRAVATVEGPRQRTFIGRADIYDEQNEHVAGFSSTFKIARGQGFDDEPAPA